MTVENSTKDSSQVLKGMVHRMAPEVIRSKLQEYLRCLKEGVWYHCIFNQGTLLIRTSWNEDTSICRTHVTVPSVHFNQDT